MATAKELGLKSGDTIFVLHASRKIPGGIHLNCPLDTPGAVFSFKQVLVEGVGLSTNTMNGATRIRRIGLPPTVQEQEEAIDVWEGFNGFVDKRDQSTRETMLKAGIRIQGSTNIKDGTITYELVRIDSSHELNEG